MILLNPSKKEEQLFKSKIKHQRISKYHKRATICIECYPQGLGARPALSA